MHCPRLFLRLLLAAFLLPLVLSPIPAQSQPAKVEKAEKATVPLQWISTFSWRSIGPANMSGRITALAVNERDPNTWWAATASGGLLKTVNNGMTFEHQFDREATVSIGDVQVARSNPNIVWVGTGEANPRNSVSWGDGVYKSIDGGKTWKNMGLKKIFQTGRIAIHPKNPNIVYVGALGRLWGPSQERGLFKTTDGGETWNKILFIDEKTGIVDVQMHPKDPETLLVAAYERERDGFDSNDPAKKFGPGSGLYKTTDGGKKFKKLTKGLPDCNLGRIGLAYYRRDPNLVYLVLESEKIGQEPPDAPFLGLRGTDAEVGMKIEEVVKKGPAEKAGLKKGDIVISVNGRIVHSNGEFLRHVRESYIAGDKLKLEVSRQREGVEIELVVGKRPKPKEESSRHSSSPFRGGLGGQRENMQDQQGKQGPQHGGIYRSEDGGNTWTRINSVNPRPMYYSQIRVDPSDKKNIIVLGTALYRSVDGGETFTADGAKGGVHVDHHAMWIDPRDGRHIILGNDGGIYVSQDRTATWDHLNHMAIGQFYHVTVGPRRDYRVYGGLQDNGTWGGPSRVRGSSGPVNGDWMRIGGGDGFICQVDPNDADEIYFESQNGAMGRINLRTGRRGSLRPRAPKDVKYRFNWKTPFLLSTHNPAIHYSAGNYVFRSIDKGGSIKSISPEITRTDQGAGSAIAESPVDADVLYAGTTDGALWMTQDGGANWIDLFAEPPKNEPEEKKEEAKPADKKTDDKKTDDKKTDDKETDDKEAEPKDGSKPLREWLPEPRWVSSIEASRAVAGRVYITLDGHRSNDDRSLIFASENHGKTWRSLRANLPGDAGSTRVVREDIKNPNVLYLGAEFAAWVSIDRGQSWTKLNSNLPTVAVHEIAIHPTAGEIVAGTHGRSLWILDVTALRQMSAETLRADAHLYRPNDVVRWHYQPSRGSSGTRRFVGQNPPTGTKIYYSLGKDAKAVKLKITDIEGRTLREFGGNNKAGLHSVAWDLRGKIQGGSTARPGTYLVTLTVDEQEHRSPLTVLADPDFPDSSLTREEHEEWEIQFRDKEEHEQPNQESRIQ
ncbi:MAG: PDZ domain-containing protein [Thermoguttaceae bacterium]